MPGLSVGQCIERKNLTISICCLFRALSAEAGLDCRARSSSKRCFSAASAASLTVRCPAASAARKTPASSALTAGILTALTSGILTALSSPAGEAHSAAAAAVVRDSTVEADAYGIIRHCHFTTSADLKTGR